MTKSGNQPRLLTAVMEAIANLKEGRGSTQKKIIDQVQCLLTANKMSFRNPTVHIKKAIRHGVKAGLIRQKGGKFKLGLDPKDYAIFKNFQKMKRRKELPLRELKKGRRRRKKSKRRRRKRRSMDRSSPDDYISQSGSASDSITGTPEPSDKGKRRRRRRRRKRGRKRTEEREWSSGHASSETKELSPSVSNEHPRGHSKSERDRDRDRDRESRDIRDRDRERNRDRDRDEGHCDEENYEERNLDDPACGNPKCLCTLKSKITMSRES